MSDGRRFLLMAIYATWVFVFAYAFVAYARAPYAGAGLPDGLNRPAVYLGWQGIAGMLALAVYGIGLGWPKGSTVRALAAVPLVMALLHLLAIGAMILWADGI